MKVVQIWNHIKTQKSPAFIHVKQVSGLCHKMYSLILKQLQLRRSQVPEARQGQPWKVAKAGGSHQAQATHHLQSIIQKLLIYSTVVSKKFLFMQAFLFCRWPSDCKMSPPAVSVLILLSHNTQEHWGHSETPAEHFYILALFTAFLFCSVY